jgi:hypothetical protein
MFLICFTLTFLCDYFFIYVFCLTLFIKFELFCVVEHVVRVEGEIST